MTDAAVQRGFEAARVLKHATTIFRRDAFKIMLLSALFVALPDRGMNALTGVFSRPETGYAAPNTWIMLLVSLLVSMLGSVALQAAISRSALSGLEGPHAAGAASFGGPRDYLTLLALGVVTSLGILGGFVLLVIPGVILSLAWMVVVPAMVTERLGVWDAIRRSNRLTGERRGAIFGLSLAVGLVWFVFAWLIQLAASAVGNPVVDAIAEPTMQALLSIVNALLAVSIYYELRWSKEGTPAESLAEVFA
jgi:hypothetical protein